LIIVDTLTGAWRYGTGNVGGGAYHLGRSEGPYSRYRKNAEAIRVFSRSRDEEDLRRATQLCSQVHSTEEVRSHTSPKAGARRSSTAQKSRFVCSFFVFIKEVVTTWRSSSRVPFTAADDHNLCQYIASRRPDKESGGRFGKILYQNLVDMVRRVFWVYDPMSDLAITVGAETRHRSFRICLGQTTHLASLEGTIQAELCKTRSDNR